MLFLQAASLWYSHDVAGKEQLLRCVDVTEGKGLELGPLHRPLLSKDEAKIYYVDHMSTQDLRKKYKGHPFSVKEIVQVDYVLQNNSLKQTVKGKKFSYVVASHVIEHIPDTVSWLKDVASVLEDGGVLFLVIPDKRFTFDILREVSRPADVIGAYLDKHTRASSAVLYDFFSEVRKNIDSAYVWHHPYEDYSKHTHNYSLKRSYDKCLENLKPDSYVDSHCFVFTPQSFCVILKRLIQHDLLGYEVVYFEETPQDQLEFYVGLRKSKNSTRAKKLRSLPKLPQPVERRELEEEVERLRTDLHNMRASRSWKITKPIRVVVTGIKKLRRRA